MDSLLKEKEALLANIKQLEIEIKSSTEQNASLTSNLESARVFRFSFSFHVERNRRTQAASRTSKGNT